jgi:small subunit ribosomal protein S1
MDIISTKVLDANKGGLMVEINGITGFIPVSQLSSEHYPRVEDGDKNKILELLKKLVGKEISVRILDVDSETEKLIASERAASSEKEKEVISQLKVGDVIEGEVSGVVDFGAFVKFLPPSKAGSDRDSDKLEGLVHISELAWQLINDPRTIVKTGDKVKAKIISIDDTRISLSMKALAKDPWSEISEKYKVGDIVKGKIDKINPFGAFVYLDKDIHGLAHVSEFQEVYPGKKMNEVLQAGETYSWKILSIEPKDHRMGLMIVKE